MTGDIPTEMPKQHFGSAFYYNVVYQFAAQLRNPTQEEMDNFYLDGRQDNTVTHQTEQHNYNWRTGAFDIVQENTDHFGPDGVKPGIGTLRKYGRAQLYSEHVRVAGTSGLIS